MRSAIIAAFAAGAIAVPHHMHKPRALVTDYDIVYVTECVTVTEGASSAAPTGDSKYNNHWHWTSHSKPAEHTTVSVKPQTSTIYVAPTSAPAVSSIVSSVVSQIPSSAPAPETTIVYSVPASQPAYSAPAPSQTPSGPSNPGAPASGSLKDVSTWIHNQHRANHSAPAIEWDDQLASIAEGIAAGKCDLGHVMGQGGLNYGQNLAWSSGKDYWHLHNIWYEEMATYDFNDPSASGSYEVWGHFTQMVWKDSNKVGCAMNEGCTDPWGHQASLLVCNYMNRGNDDGEYTNNVGAPLNQPACPKDSSAATSAGVSA